MGMAAPTSVWTRGPVGAADSTPVISGRSSTCLGINSLSEPPLTRAAKRAMTWFITEWQFFSSSFQPAVFDTLSAFCNANTFTYGSTHVKNESQVTCTMNSTAFVLSL